MNSIEGIWLTKNEGEDGRPRATLQGNKLVIRIDRGDKIAREAKNEIQEDIKKALEDLTLL